MSDAESRGEPRQTSRQRMREATLARILSPAKGGTTIENVAVSVFFVKGNPSRLSDAAGERCIGYKSVKTITYGEKRPKIIGKPQLDKSRKALTRVLPESPFLKQFAKLCPRGVSPHGENAGLTKGRGTSPFETRAYSGRFFCQEKP